MKKLLKVALIMLLIGLCGSVATASMTDVFSFETVDVNKSEEIAGDRIKKINIKTSSVDIKVVPGKSDQIKVNFSGKVSKRLKDTYDLVVEKSQDEVEIEVTSDDLYFYIGIPVIRLDLVVEVPEKEYEQMMVTASSGDINLQGLHVNDFQFNTSSGDMEITEIEGKVIRAEASSGSISMMNVLAENSTYEASSGDIILDNNEGNIKVVTSSGTIDINNEKLSGDVFAEASSGDVNVSFVEKPSSVIIEFHGSSGEGKVRLDGVNYEEKSENKIIGSIGSGEYKLKVNTSSGDFNLDS